MNRRIESRRAVDAKRRASNPARKWYQTKAWKVRRARQLAAVPWCERCKATGRSRPANTADHDPPHRGDRHAFFHGPLTSLCENCHNSPKQREEREGFSREIGADGWPLDVARHPFHRRK